jgi:hypothetical protein
MTVARSRATWHRCRRPGPMRRLLSRISISWQVLLAREDLVRLEAQVAHWRLEALAPDPAD